MRKFQLTVFCLLLWSLSTTAQIDYSTPEDHQLMFNDLYHTKDYEEAILNLDWLFNQSVDLEEKYYAKGSKMYDALIKEENDPAKQLNLKNRAIDLIERRMAKFDPQPVTINQYLTASYRYWIKSPEKYETLYPLFQRYVDHHLDEISQFNLLGYFDVLRRVERAGTPLDDDEVLEDYDRISAVFKSTSDDKGYMGKIDKMLGEIVTLDCEKLNHIYAEKIVDDLAKVSKAKQYLNLALGQNCRESALRRKAIDIVLKYEPNYSLTMYAAKKALRDNRLEDAEKYLGMALGLTDEKAQESDVYMQLANTMALKNQKAAARKYAQKAINSNQRKEAYSLIGNLYLSSFSECVGEKDIIERRAIFIAAYDQFKKAEDQKNMTLAMANFPSMEEIHMNSYTLGQKMTVSCWFTEEVALMKRE